MNRNLYRALRTKNVPAKDAAAWADVRCCECDGPADHWHTMTGTTGDDREYDLMDLVEGVTLTSEMPMACGHTAELSLESDDWWPHCEDCEPRQCDQCGADCERTTDGEWFCPDSCDDDETE